MWEGFRWGDPPFLLPATTLPPRIGSLYLHVPFCRVKCDYCAFYSITPVGDRIARYLTQVGHDLETLRRQFDLTAVRTVFVGGGNPTALGREPLAQLLNRIEGALTGARIEEFTLESNPETLEELRGVAWGTPGNRRLSVGIQRFVETERAFLGRHPVITRAEEALTLALQMTPNVGIDLILGLPETPSLADDLDIFLKRFPLTHVSAYFLSVEDGTPLQNRLDLSGSVSVEDVGPEELFQVADVLAGHGFCQYEISNFARPGYACRHNLAYWHGENYLGVGPAAVSTVRPYRCREPEDLDAWSLPGTRHLETLTRDDLWKEHLMLSLRLLEEGLEIPAFLATFARDLPGDFSSRLQQEIDQGFLTRTGGRVTLTRTGIAFANRVISRLF